MASAHDFGIAFCGGGPAALGPFVFAAQDGRLKDLLDEGVLIIERDRLGPGSFSHYSLSANSLGGAFLESLDRVGDPRFEALRAAGETSELARLADEHPPLAVVGAYLRRLGDVVQGIVEEHALCSVALDAAVEQIDLLPRGGVRVSMTREGTTSTHTAARAVIAMGGEPFGPLEETALLPGLTLHAHRHKVRPAAALFDRRFLLDASLRDAIRRTGSAVVVGGSHSGWSAALHLREDPDLRGPRGEPPRVSVLHRRGIRLFYTSADDALTDEYAFDHEADVCPLSGRINRYSGIRGPARDLARAVLRSPDEGSSGVRSMLLETSACTRVEEALADAGAILVATGFRARLPLILDAEGVPIRPVIGRTGTVVSEDAHLVDERRGPIPEIVVYGLGAGMEAGEDVGGERLDGQRADGVWLYQNDVGRVVLRALLPAGVGR